MKQQKNQENGNAGYIHEYSVVASRKKIQRAINAFFKMKRQEIIARRKRWKSYMCKFHLPTGNTYLLVRIFVEENHLKIVSELSEENIDLCGIAVKETDRFVKKLIEALS